SPRGRAGPGLFISEECTMPRGSKQLTLPDPSKVVLDQVIAVTIPEAVETRQRIAQRADIPLALELIRRLETFRKYLQDREGRDLLSAECRRTEVLIGKLLPRRDLGSNQYDEMSTSEGLHICRPSEVDISLIPPRDRHRFWLMCDHE